MATTMMMMMTMMMMITCRAKQAAAALWFNRGDLSYQAVPSVRVSVSAEHVHRTPVCSCRPPCGGPCRLSAPSLSSSRTAVRGCPTRRCGCRPPCPGPCRRAATLPPPQPPPPPRTLAVGGCRDVMDERLAEADTRGLLQNPLRPCSESREPEEKEDPLEKYKDGLAIGKGAMIFSRE